MKREDLINDIVALDGMRRIRFGQSDPIHTKCEIVSIGEALVITICDWSDAILHIVSTAVASAGDKGWLVIASSSQDDDWMHVWPWLLLFHGYSTGATYEDSLAWVQARSTSLSFIEPTHTIDFNDPRWKAVKQFLWTQGL